MTEQEMKKNFLPKKGNYRGLFVYQKAKCIYGITFFFAHLIGLMGCSGSGGDTVGQAPTPVTEVAISFSGAESQEEAVNNGANRAYDLRRAAGTPLSGSGVTTFHVWGYKNMDYNDGTGAYGGTQKVFPGYQVDWHDGTASTTTTNSSG